MPGTSRQTLKLISAMFIGGPLFTFASVPIVQMLFNVPAYSGIPLSQVSVGAAYVIGTLFFVGLLAGALWLRWRSWRFLIITAALLTSVYVISAAIYWR